MLAIKSTLKFFIFSKWQLHLNFYLKLKIFNAMKNE